MSEGTLAIAASTTCCERSSWASTTSVVYRQYCSANLAVRRRKKCKRAINERVPLQLARTVNEV